MKKKIFEIFKTKYIDGTVLTKDELYEFFNNYYQNISESSLSWRIYELKKLGLLTKLNTKAFRVNTIHRKIDLNINVNSEIVGILKEYNKRNILKNSNDMTISIWESKLLNKFMQHQTMINYTLIETNKYRMENLFYFLKARYDNVFINVSEKYAQLYFSYKKDIIIVKPLIKRAPLEKSNVIDNNFVLTPKIEKILVDIMQEKTIFNMLDKSEITNIYRQIISKYNIDFTTLLYYARNRGVKEKLIDFLTNDVGFDLSRGRMNDY